MRLQQHDKLSQLLEHFTFACDAIRSGDLSDIQTQHICKGMLALLTAIEYASHECDENKTGVVVPEHQWPEHARWLGCLMEVLNTKQRQGSAA